MRIKDIQFFNAIKIHHVEDIAKKLYPQLKIDEYELIKYCT